MSLLGDTIQRILRPVTNGKPKMKISVVYRGSVMWSIPLDRCQTFFVRAPSSLILRKETNEPV